MQSKGTPVLGLFGSLYVLRGLGAGTSVVADRDRWAPGARRIESDVQHRTPYSPHPSPYTLSDSFQAKIVGTTGQTPDRVCHREWTQLCVVLCGCSCNHEKLLSCQQREQQLNTECAARDAETTFSGFVLFFATETRIAQKLQIKSHQQGFTREKYNMHLRIYQMQRTNHRPNAAKRSSNFRRRLGNCKLHTRSKKFQPHAFCRCQKRNCTCSTCAHPFKTLLSSKHEWTGANHCISKQDQEMAIYALWLALALQQQQLQKQHKSSKMQRTHGQCDMKRSRETVF